MSNKLFDNELPVKLYSSASLWFENVEEAEKYFGKIPHTLGEAVEFGYNILEKARKFAQPFSRELGEALLRWHEERGILTEKVRRNISRMKDGVILSGQQTTIFGGVGLIANKICCTKALSLISEAGVQEDESKPPLIPAFIVNDYDTVQPELTVTHFPNPSSFKGTAISIDLSDISGHAISFAERPAEEWLKNSLKTIEDLYNEFIHSAPKERQIIFRNRLEEIKSFLRIAFFAANSLADWVGRIWGTIMNTILDLGIVFIPPSLPEIRKVKVKAFEYLLGNLEKFIAAGNSAAETLESLGLRPTLYQRTDEYVPFFLECPNDGYRLELTRTKGSNGRMLIDGKCPVCKTKHEIEVDPKDIDLSEWAQHLSPRVDTSEISYQSIFPVAIRVSGPGEISYYAQVIPAFRAIAVQPPIFVKYTRMFYNAPWNESLGKELAQQDKLTIHHSEFFKLLRNWVKARKRKAPEDFFDANRKITETLEAFRKRMEDDEEVKKYYSWQFGKYSEGKFGQEVSWNWIDLAIAGGLRAFIPTIMRFYEKETPIGGNFFLNLY